MEKLSSKCNSCFSIIRYPDSAEGKLIKCPKCGNETKLVSMMTNATPAKLPVTPTLGEKNIIPTSNEKQETKLNFSDLPHRMKASKALDGTTCTICGVDVDLGQDIINCKTCNGSIMHLECFEKNGVCGNISCESSLEKITPIGLPKAVEDSADSDLKDCPYCGEKIKSQSKKCRFCGEYLDKKLRDIENQRKSKNDAEDKLAISEIIFCALCGGLACIVSIVFIIQGKKKGWKMLLISFFSMIFWSIIRGLGSL